MADLPLQLLGSCVHDKSGAGVLLHLPDDLTSKGTWKDKFLLIQCYLSGELCLLTLHNLKIQVLG